MTFKNKLPAMLYTVILGSITGVIVWSFLKVMNLGIEFLWDYVPKQFSFPLYTVAVCLVGSLLIGFYKSKFGDYPEELNTVMAKLKKDGRYPYNNIFAVLGAALFPLLIGAAIGPEAGLTGVIAGLCCWVGDKLKRYYKEADDLAAIGTSATLATIFRSPMFGFVEPLEGESDAKLPKASKTVLYIAAILSSLLCFIGLNKLTGGSTGFPSVEFGGAEFKDYLWAILLAVVGIVMGLIFIVFEKLIYKKDGQHTDNQCSQQQRCQPEGLVLQCLILQRLVVIFRFHFAQLSLRVVSLQRVRDVICTLIVVLVLADIAMA